MKNKNLKDRGFEVFIKIILMFIIFFIIMLIFIFLYNKYLYYSQVLMQKEDFIKEGERFYYENKEGFSKVLSILLQLKYYTSCDDDFDIGKTPSGIHIFGCMHWDKVPKSYKDYSFKVLNNYRDLCKYSFYDKSGNFISISFDKHVNIKRENYRIAYIVDQEDFNFYKNYKFYPHDSIPKEETHFAYQIEGNWYFISP